jgi:hypothetical protein
MLLTLFKIGSFFFPFIKNLFVTKSQPITKRNRKQVIEDSQTSSLKTIFVFLGCVSILTNVYMFNRLYILSTNYSVLSKKYDTLLPGHIPILEPKKKPPTPPIVDTAIEPTVEELPVVPVDTSKKKKSIKIKTKPPILQVPDPSTELEKENLERLRRFNNNNNNLINNSNTYKGG